MRDAPRDDGVDLAGYSLPERVDDLEAARRALGDGRIDLLSESAGTRTAMIYAWRYPKSIHRSVMIGVNPPGKFLWDAKTTGDQVGRYAALCAQATRLPEPHADLSASVHSAFGHIPGHWWFLPIQKGNVQVGVVLRPHERDERRRRPARGAADARHAAVDRRGRRRAARGSCPSVAGLAFPSGQVWGDVAAVGRTDAAYAKAFFAAHADRGSVIGGPGTDLIWAGGKLVDAWPANPDENEYTQVRDSKVETLLIGGDARLRNPATERDPGAAAPPLERAPGRPAEARSRRRLLGLRAGRVHEADRHVPRPRPGRHLALHREPARLRAVVHARR